MEKVNEIKILGLGDKELESVSKKYLLSLNLEEMKVIQEYYKKEKRNPTDIELECLAQTWSEHCKHKVFTGIIEYEGEGKKELIENLMKQTIKKATEEIAGKVDWLVSVFKDNAGIIRFNDEFDVAFKVETHNHPSALDPYGGANTGVGGVVRDILGCGLGAKPIANTDVFCFAEPDYQREKIPKSILHPKRIAKGVRAGVRDYGNRLGIPTVNGAICFDERYLGNPLVYCGTVGLIPRKMHEKKALTGELIIVVGGRTGRDGLHGATFSSIELTEETSSSAVQIGNAIEEKKMLDVLLNARDLGLYDCVTDCGAGGFSSAVGEMAEEIGARVYLEKAPLKYRGLKPWEIWLSEAQERMVLAVKPENKEKVLKLFEDEDVEATVIGEFTDTKKLELFYEKELVGELEMEFLHNGLPKSKRKAFWKKKKFPEPDFSQPNDLGKELKKVLAMPNIASKETTIRQYDHEVQGGTILKPLVGENFDGPGDAAVLTPVLGRFEGVIISNGINPCLGDIDPYWMAASEIDEAIRNIVAVGGNLGEIALLDNFCWGNPNKEEKLGELVRAAKACYDIAREFGTPFISGKDSFYNEFILEGETISVPATLLISALGIVKDARKRISMDFKEKGNLVYVVGETFNELGGSHYLRLHGFKGNLVPKVNVGKAKKLYKALSELSSVGERNSERVIRAMHDCSEGGLAVALAEMAFAGNLGAEVKLNRVPLGEKIERDDFLLFSESNSRLIVEVPERFKEKFEKGLKGNKFALIGRVTDSKKLVVVGREGKKLIEEDVSELKKAWKETLNW